MTDHYAQLGKPGGDAKCCVEFACSPRVPYRYPHKKHAVIMVTITSPPGQPGHLMEGNGSGWNNVFLPRATSYRGNSPLSGEKKRPANSSCIGGSMSSVRGSPQVGRGRVVPRITA